MATLEQLALAALSGDALGVRSLAQDWLRENPRLANAPRPASESPDVLALSAALVELFAERAGQPAPAWTRDIGGVAEPRFLVRAAMTMRRLRRACELESPPPLRRRNLFAPADYLSFA